MPADDHQIGARGQARQHVSRMAAHDIRGHPDLRVFLPPDPQRGREMPVRGGRQRRVSRRRGVLVEDDGSPDTACTAVRFAPRSAASSNANPSVSSASPGSRTPTTISRCTATVSSRTTTTGHGAHAATCLLTEPSMSAAKPPAPRAPTHEQLRACPAVRHGDRGWPV